MVILLLLTVFLAQISEQSDQQCSGTRIVGGQSVDIKNYPYNVGVFYHDSFTCGGALIGNKYVLTAAHCTFGFSIEDLSVKAGSSNRQDGETFSINAIHQHPDYSYELYTNDISVLELSSPIEIDIMQTIKIADNTNYKIGDLATVTGWGCLQENGTLADQLQMVQINIIDETICTNLYNASFTSTKICAGILGGGKDSCWGDSGGPLVVNDILIGVVSAGGGCGKANTPGLYSDVADASSFIKGIIGNSQPKTRFNFSLLYCVVFVVFRFSIVN